MVDINVQNKGQERLAVYFWDTAESAAGRFAREHSLSEKLHLKLVALLAQKMAAHDVP